MKFPAKLAQGAFTAALVMASRDEKMPMVYPLKKEAAASAIVSFDFPSPSFKTPWGVNLTENPLDTDNNEEPLTFLDKLSPAINGVSVVGTLLAESFIKAHQDKETRIEHIRPLAKEILRPITAEVKSKVIEVLTSSPEQQKALGDQLKAVQDEHKQNKGHINTVKQGKDAIGFAATLIEELKPILPQKIDPKTVDTAVKVLRASGKVAANAIPVLRALNNLSAAYDVAKIAYPEHTEKLENYVTDKVKTHANGAQEGFTNVTSSFKARYAAQRAERLALTEPKPTVNEPPTLTGPK